MEARYLFSLMRAVIDVRLLRAWPVRVAVIVPAALFIFALVTAFGVPGALGSITGSQIEHSTAALSERATTVKLALQRVDNLYEEEVRPLARIIMSYRNDERLARRVATALVREGHRAGVAPDILLAVLLVENPWINPSAQSPVGARGLMQVMPLHRGKWKACPVSLDEIESNICYGAQIFRSYLREEKGQLEAALLRYNGCVNGTNTPNCAQYPSAVFARTGRATMRRNALHSHGAD